MDFMAKIYSDNIVIWEPDESHVSFALDDAYSRPPFQRDFLPVLRRANLLLNLQQNKFNTTWGSSVVDDLMSDCSR